MEFEYDQSKSDANKVKHGVDFVEAQALWADPNALQIPVMTVPEPRWLVTGLIGETIWSVCITYRQDRSRIISCRRARKEERKAYGAQT